MAQTGYTPISIYYSATTSNVPTAGNLVAGELAINTADGKLFYKDSSGVVQVIAGKGGAGVAGGSNTQVQYNSSGSLAGSAGFIYDGQGVYLNYSNNTFNAGLGITNTNAGVQAQSKIVLTNDVSKALALIQNGSGVSSGVAFIGTSSTQALTLGTSYAEQMRLTNNGQALFATASINSGVKVASYAVDSSAYSLGLFGDTYGVRFSGTTSSYNIEGVDKTLVGSFQPITLGGGGYIGFRTGSAGGGSLAERARIDGNGNFLLGGTSALGASLLTCYGRMWVGTGTSNGDAEIKWSNNASTNPASALSVRTDIGGSNNDLKFLWFNTSGTYQGVAMQIAQATGYIGIGASSGNVPSKLTVNGGGASGACDQVRIGQDSNWYYMGRDDVYGPWRMTGTQTGVVGYEWRYLNGGGTPISMMYLDTASNLTIAGGTATKASGTTWANPSDVRLKDNVEDFTKGLAELQQVKVKTWEYNGKGNTIAGSKGLGVIADEIMQVLPDTVDTYKAKLNEGDEEETEIKRFDATEITWLLVNSVKELKARIETLEAQLVTKG